jgi:malate dehydrogenase (oxaloacetate-decarboxylating)
MRHSTDIFLDDKERTMSVRQSLVTYTKEEALNYHSNNFGGGGKIEVISKVPTLGVKDLTLAYSPGVAEVCRAIAREPDKIHDYTIKDNLVAVVTDGTAILGLGNIGPRAGIPVMEGKCVLFKNLAGVDAFPIILDTSDPEQIIMIVRNLEPLFGGINLEDIAAPACFQILEKLRREMPIPVFHDDQHGTAVVTLAAMFNALKVVGKKFAEIKVAVNGAGASGIAVTKLLMSAGVREVILSDTRGTVYEGRTANMNRYKEEIALLTNRNKVQGTLADALRGADVFIGLSVAKQVTQAMVKSMAKDPIVMAMANPDPEIFPEEAIEAGAKVVATGRSDYPNQINNVLGFPGIFRGALDVRASDINEPMLVAAAQALASLVSPSELNENYIITTPFDVRAMPTEAMAVAKAAVDGGIARSPQNLESVKMRTEKLTQTIRERYAKTQDLGKES